MFARRLLAAFVLAGFAVAPLAADAAAPPDQKHLAESAVDRNASTIAQVGDAIYYFGELGYQEVESTKLLRDVLSSAGFHVEMGGAGMPTNLWATYGSGHPYIMLETEVDALPGGSQTPDVFTHKPLVDGAPGHMEGHNTHGAVATAALFAAKEVMDRYHLPGTIGVHFGPAEEILGSRPYVVKSGAFKDVDAVLYLHIGDNFSTGWGLQNYAAISTRFTFHGKTAHGAVDPWDGRNALDAVELMDSGVAFLRQQLYPSFRIHRAVMNGGLQPNIIPDLAQVWYFVRDRSMPEAKSDWDRVVKVAQGAAMMTDTTVDVTYDASAWPQLGNKTLAQTLQANIDAIGLPAWTPQEQTYAKGLQAALKVPQIGLAAAPVTGTRPQSFASNDSGDVSWVVPAGVFTFPASVPGIQYHNWQAGVTPVSSIAHKGEVAGAKVLADTLLDLLETPSTITAAKAEFTATTTATPYFSVVPDTAKPNLDVNKATMEKYRPAMSAFYTHTSPRYH